MSARIATAGAGALLAVLLLSDYWLLVLAISAAYALACLSLVILVGWSGQLNLHVAALGLGWGAYAAFALTTAGVPPLVAILAVGVVTAPAAVLVGAIAVRFRGLELAVATLAIGLIFERLAFRNIGRALAQRADAGTPFESSFVSMPRPGFASSDAAFFLLSVAVLAVVAVAVAAAARGPAGRTLRAIREREARAETLGVPVVRWRIGVFAVSIVVASVAGALLAGAKLGITPDTFTIDLSFRLLAAVVIGGIGSVRGALIGGVLVGVVPELVAFGPLRVFEGERLFLLFGIGMILVLWRWPAGLAGDRRTAPAAPVAVGLAPRSVTPRTRGPRHLRPAALRAEGIHVSFGGLRALDGASVAVAEGEICALIGPNGAGKSTLFDVLAGLRVSDAGRVYLGGRDVTETPAHRRARAGLGRTFQGAEVFARASVLDNLLVAAGRGSLARDDRTARDEARAVAASLGFQPLLDATAGELPLGLARVLEIGMALAARPNVLLLDEPAAGLDEHETEALAAIIHAARDERGLSVLVVEHDMALVARLAEHVIVLDAGRVIAAGGLEEIRRDPVVVERYLGRAREVAHAGA